MEGRNCLHHDGRSQVRVTVLYSRCLRETQFRLLSFCVSYTEEGRGQLRCTKWERERPLIHRVFWIVPRMGGGEIR